MSIVLKFSKMSLRLGYIINGDLLTSMPFENSIERVTVKGADLLLALENSVARFSPENMPGAFLQFSGKYSFKRL